MQSGVYILIIILKINFMLNKAIKLITKGQLEIINREDLKYPLAIAEKDYFLALISKIIFNSSIKDKLIFKGGTALHHVYLPQLRFSEDLDFSSDAILIKLDELKHIFTPFNFLHIKKDYSSRATIKIEKLQYFGVLDQPNFVKVEIDFLQNVVLKPLELKYNNNYGINTKVRVMDIREITAEKIRAMSDRIRYRDFYDFAMIMIKLKIDLDQVLALLKKKEIRSDINVKKIKNNFELASKEKALDFNNIYCTHELTDLEIKNELKKLKFRNLKANI